jgi:hypothetical protein
MARLSEREQRSWDNYLEDHPQIARDLSHDPELINDARFVHDRRSLDDWLHEHPAAARVIQASPREYIPRGGVTASRYDYEPPTVEDIQSFERYLDRNWEVAEELYRNPQLINEAGYVHARPSLNDWLDDHPRAARAIQAEPERFLWRQRALNLNDFLRQALTPR